MPEEISREPVGIVGTWVFKPLRKKSAYLSAVYCLQYCPRLQLLSTAIWGKGSDAG